MNSNADYLHRRKTSDQQQPDLDQTIEQLNLTQQQPTRVKPDKNQTQLSEQTTDQETDKQVNSPKLGKEFGHLPASYYLDPASEQIEGAGKLGKSITPAGYAAFGKLGIDFSKLGAAKERPTLDSRLEAIRVQRHSFDTPPTPEPDQVKLLGEKSAEQQPLKQNEKSAEQESLMLNEGVEQGKNLHENIPNNPTPQPPNGLDAEFPQERIDPSQMTLDQRIAHNRANSASPEQLEQSKQINKNLTR
jgi:hypothetical protein